MLNGSAVEAEQLRLFEGGIDVSRLRERRESLRLIHKKARLTIRGYSADVRVFERWCHDAGRKSLPCSAETVSLYVTWLLEVKNRKVTTAARHVSAIVDLHRRASKEPPSIADAREAIATVRNERGEKPQGKAALGTDDLVRIARSCDLSTNAGLRDRAIVVLGFATTLRRSEIARLNLADVAFHEQGLSIILHRSKTDQGGRGRIIPVWRGKRASTDPVAVLTAWIAARGDWDGPLFCRIQTGDRIMKLGITGDAVNDLVKRSVARVGLDAGRYGAHSLRAGAVTASAELGCSDQEIMLMSGHQSAEIMRMYVRRARLFSGRNPLAGVL